MPKNRDLLSQVPHIERQLFACMQCGYCKSGCPTYEQVGWESRTPRGILYFLKQYFQSSFMDPLVGREKFKITPTFVRRVYQCTGCGACTYNCHTEIDFIELWEDLKAWLVEHGYAPLPEHKAANDNIMSVRNPFKAEPDERVKWFSGKFEPPEKSELLYWSGCIGSYMVFKVSDSALKILKKSNVDFTMLGMDEWCCGNILDLTGQRDGLKELAQHNVEAIQARGVQRMVTSCPGCYRTFTKVYPKYVGKLGFEVLHFTEYLNELLDEEKIKFKDKPFRKKLTYHDPCELGRICGIFEPPRQLIEQIPSVKFEELYYNKTKANCCGSGGGFNLIEPEMANNISYNKVDEVIETGADIVTTSCPNCRFTINHAILDKKKIASETGGPRVNVNIRDLTELLTTLIA